MFTGIIQGIGQVEAVENGTRLGVRLPEGWVVEPGDSVAVAGVCLTVSGVGAGPTVFDLSQETLSVTRLGDLEPGDAVNLEQPLLMGDPLGGHLVQGHVDGQGRVSALTAEEGGCARLVVAMGAGLVADTLVAKGSVAVDGVSLTVAALDGGTFECALVPETMERTTLGAARTGDPVHLEADCFAKWTHTWLERTGR